MSRRGFPSKNQGHRDAKQLSKNKNRFARLDPDISSRYEDLDDEPSINVRITNISQRGRGARSNPFERRNATVANTGVRNADIVYKIKVPNGARKFEAKWVLKQLSQKIENFKPILVQETVRGDIEFYVRDEDTSSAIRINSRRIYHRESASKVDFVVSKVPAPWMALKKQDVEIINKVVDSRYHAESRMLDLSDFANDSEFTSKDLLMTLTKGNVMLAVVDRIDERYGNITALSLANNRLRHLDYAAALVSIAKFVKVLELSHNTVSTEEELRKFCGLPVERLYFEGNPVCEQMSSASQYLSFIQTTFPRCAMLDGVEVTPLVTGPDADNEEGLPFKPGYYVKPEIRQLVVQFIDSFFELYDGTNGPISRKQLFQAYDEHNSKFTLTIARINGGPKFPQEVYDTYARMSHNVLTQEFFARNRSARTARGAMDIAVALSKLPITNHLPDTFVADVFLVSNELLGFTIQGLFEDGKLAQEGEVPQLHLFSRTFTVAPRDLGRVAVISDQLFITTASTERLTRYRDLLNQAKRNENAEPENPVSQATIGINGIGFDGEPSQDVKDQMIAAFCQFSGMVVTWSEKCLQDLAWNFDAACQKFIQLKDTIPPEAFANQIAVKMV